jgi:TonB family protein
MRPLESWVLGYLLNSIWQVPLVFLAAWTAARLVRAAGPRMEHRVWVGALMLEVALPGCHLRIGDLWQTIEGFLTWSWGGGVARGETQAAIGAGSVSGMGVLRLPGELPAAVVLMYGGSLLYFAGRLAWGVWRTYGMHRQAEPVTLTGEAAWSWQRCGNVLEFRSPVRAGKGVHPAEIAISPMISGPVTVGIRRGVLLVPPGFLESVNEGDLDAVLAHEFAHMQRKDFAKNLIYGVLALPVSYHPLLWLTRSRLAESREMVCDAMAAEAVAGRESYARSLLRLASLLSDPTPSRTLHAIGIFDANIFERRIMNLTRRTIEIRGARRFAVVAACVVVGLATCASALALRMEVSGPGATPSENSSSQKRLTIPAGTMAGMTLYRKNPLYPPEAKANKDTIDGPVVLAVTINKDGSVQDIRVQKSLRPDYDQSALDAVREWRWKPYLLNGEPVEVDSTVTVTYSIAH